MSELHPVNCVCPDCWAHDCDLIISAHTRGTWTPHSLEWIRGLRKRQDLNWTLEPGHCVLCGGTRFMDYHDHFEVLPYNVQVIQGTTYMSWLFANDAGPHAAYTAVSRKGKDALRDWAARCIVGASIPKENRDFWRLANHTTKLANKIAVREVDRAGTVWTEIRVGINAG